MIEINIAFREHGNQLGITGFEPIDFSIFKGGEPNPRLTAYQIEAIKSAERVTLKAHLSNTTDILLLILITDAIRRVKPRVEINAVIPYIPFGRQDRVCNPGEALGITVMARLINDLNFSEVFILDPHSDVTGALINNSVTIPLEEYILSNETFPGLDLREVYLVSPDAGAQKKVKALTTALGCKGYINATKERDLETMEITGTKFDADVTGKKLLVVDDICDGGRTFIALAKAIREHNPDELHLWVTHGIFSYGTKVVTDHFDSVGTTNSFQYAAEGQVDAEGNRDYKMHWFRI